MNEQLESYEVVDRVRRLQGKETVETPVDDNIDEEEGENEELFKKYITSPGLKEKKLQSKKKGMSQNKMIAYALLAAAFIIGIGFGVFTLDLPTDATSALYTNDSAFPPFIVNNTTNMTNTTNTTNMTNTTKKLNTTTTTKPTINTTKPIQTNTTPDENTKSGAGDPSETKTNTKPDNKNYSD